MPHSATSPRTIFLFVAVLACLIVPQIERVISEPVPLLIFFGLLLIVIHGALSLLTVEFVWGTASFGHRMKVYFIWFLLGLSAWLLPVGFQNRLGLGDLNLLSCLPLIALSSQIPLWIVRFFLRCRLVELEARAVRRDLWSLRDFGIGTMFLAVSLAAPRLFDSGTATESGFALIAIPSFITPILFTLPPVLYLLRPQSDDGLYNGILFQLLVLTPIVILLLGMLGVFPNERVVGVAFWAIFCLSVGPVVTFFLLRKLGYRLIWLNETQWPGEINGHGSNTAEAPKASEK